MKFKRNGKRIEAKKKLIPEGDYRAEIKDVKLDMEMKSKFGTGSCLVITYELEDESGVASFTKVDFVWCSEGEGSRCMQLLDALYDGNPPEEPELQDWIGCRGWVEIKHDKEEKYDNIVSWDFSDDDEGIENDEISFDEEDEE